MESERKLIAWAQSSKEGYELISRLPAPDSAGYAEIYEELHILGDRLVKEALNKGLDELVFERMRPVYAELRLHDPTPNKEDPDYEEKRLHLIQKYKDYENAHENDSRFSNDSCKKVLEIIGKDPFYFMNKPTYKEMVRAFLKTLNEEVDWTPFELTDC